MDVAPAARRLGRSLRINLGFGSVVKCERHLTSTSPHNEAGHGTLLGGGAGQVCKNLVYLGGAKQGFVLR